MKPSIRRTYGTKAIRTPIAADMENGRAAGYEAVELRAIGGETPRGWADALQPAMGEYDHCHHPRMGRRAVEQRVDCVRTGVGPSVTAENPRHVTWTMESACRAARTGQRLDLTTTF